VLLAVAVSCTVDLSSSIALPDKECDTGPDEHRFTPHTARLSFDSWHLRSTFTWKLMPVEKEQRVRPEAATKRFQVLVPVRARSKHQRPVT
jgi:hypothetical protein